MPTFINRYIHIVTQESRSLINDKFEKLNPIQAQTIQSIINHSEDLCLFISKLEEKDTGSTNRHDLLNMITPISGYIDMLSDGWMGDLNEQQHDRIQLISLAVYRLIDYVQSYPTEKRQPIASLP